VFLTIKVEPGAAILSFWASDVTASAPGSFPGGLRIRDDVNCPRSMNSLEVILGSGPRC